MILLNFSPIAGGGGRIHTYNIQFMRLAFSVTLTKAPQALREGLEPPTLAVIHSNALPLSYLRIKFVRKGTKVLVEILPHVVVGKVGVNPHSQFFKTVSL